MNNLIALATNYNFASAIALFTLWVFFLALAINMIQGPDRKGLPLIILIVIELSWPIAIAIWERL